MAHGDLDNIQQHPEHGPLQLKVHRDSDIRLVIW